MLEKTKSYANKRIARERKNDASVNSNNSNNKNMGIKSRINMKIAWDNMKSEKKTYLRIYAARERHRTVLTKCLLLG